MNLRVVSRDIPPLNTAFTRFSFQKRSTFLEYHLSVCIILIGMDPTTSISYLPHSNIISPLGLFTPLCEPQSCPNPPLSQLHQSLIYPYILPIPTHHLYFALSIYQLFKSHPLVPSKTGSTAHHPLVKTPVTLDPPTSTIDKQTNIRLKSNTTHENARSTHEPSAQKTERQSKQARQSNRLVLIQTASLRLVLPK